MRRAPTGRANRGFRAPAYGRGKSSSLNPGSQRGGASGDGGEPLPGCSSGDGTTGDGALGVTSGWTVFGSAWSANMGSATDAAAGTGGAAAGSNCGSDAAAAGVLAIRPQDAGPGAAWLPRH